MFNGDINNHSEISESLSKIILGCLNQKRPTSMLRLEIKILDEGLGSRSIGRNIFVEKIIKLKSQFACQSLLCIITQIKLEIGNELINDRQTYLHAVQT